MSTFSDRVIAFNKALGFSDPLPASIRILNPFKEHPEVNRISEAFYRKFYGDSLPRTLILGINPGRLGAGATGIPFTDTKRLADPCGIVLEDFQTHEPSSVFIYRMIEAFGGPEAFYRRYFINSVCPLGFVRQNAKGNWVNCNYYDLPELFDSVRPFMVSSLRKLLDMGCSSERCYVLGKKNASYLEILNKEEGFFGELIPLDHPRYIVQYRSRYMEDYVTSYLEALSGQAT